MRKYIKYNLLGLALLAVVMAGCDTASQEVADVISPDDYPHVTFETDAQVAQSQRGIPSFIRSRLRNGWTGLLLSQHGSLEGMLQMPTLPLHRLSFLPTQVVLT